MTKTELPLGLNWELWTDGRVWRLKQGRDFHCSVADLHEAAQEAADLLEKPVRTVQDREQPDKALWLQFADHEIPVGAPCPCGSTVLHRVHTKFARCPACGSKLLLTEAEASGPPTQKKGLRLDEFSDVRLMRADENPKARLKGEQYCGVGTDAEGNVRVIFVKIPYYQGHRIPDEESSLGFVSRVTVWPLGPVEEVFDVERLYERFRDSWDLVVP